MESARFGGSISSHQRPVFDHAIRWHFYQHRNLSQTYLLAISHASYSYLVILLRPDFGVGMAYAAPSRTKKLSRFLWLIAGTIFAYGITVLKPLHLEPTYINVLISGAIAICAMILPGISGSFILLLIGMYAPVLGAVKTFQLDILLIFLTGCVIGLLSFPCSVMLYAVTAM